MCFAGLCDNRCCGFHRCLWLLTFIPALLLLLRTTSWQNAESLPANSASTVQVPSYVTSNLKLKENSRRSGVGRAFFPSPSVVRLSLIHLSMSMMLQVHKSATKEGCRSCIVNIASRVMEENLVVCVLSEEGKFGFFLFCDAEVATGKRGDVKVCATFEPCKRYGVSLRKKSMTGCSGGSGGKQTTNGQNVDARL